MAAPPQEEKKKKKRSAWPLYLILGSFVSLIPLIIGITCHRDYKTREARDRFLFSLQHGEMEAAYAELTDERRRHMSQAEFEAYMDHPVLKNLEQAVFDYPEDNHPGLCMDGYVPMPEGRWYIQLFFLKEDGQWRLHSMGLQRPARMQLGTLLPECSFWKGTLTGYNGPRPEHVMPQTRGGW